MGKLKMLSSRVVAADARTAKPWPEALDPIYSTGEHRCWRSAVIDVLVDAVRTAGAAMVASMPITSKN